MNPYSDADLGRFLAPVCAQDRDEDPFSWSEASGVAGPRYGDPRRWQSPPPALTAAVACAVAAGGWPLARPTEHGIVVPLDDRAVGLTAPAGRGEHLHVLWNCALPEWSWGTGPPDAPTSGHCDPLLTPPDHEPTITAQILRVLRTGRTLP
ncbi:hypothetical protein [Actinacidiphila sp. ITFR-21]|uniref:hypothetical protein n=1 Tax=Actinacidiphila sp. ITFR-21 TaxID=3075199 RepID=UPI00288AD5D9|nr:hypothetical protein [Streptomyces sp. ITFR-21]WNI20345.1 hypothetical protein RLT57_32600 [Streptomyces sp. ITFR-21]